MLKTRIGPIDLLRKPPKPSILNPKLWPCASAPCRPQMEAPLGLVEGTRGRHLFHLRARCPGSAAGFMKT